MVLCAEVLSYCYGEGPKLAEAWDDLSARVKSWIDSKPSSYEPLFCVPTCVVKGQIFPQIWLLNDCHGMLPLLFRATNPIIFNSLAQWQLISTT
jgi:hypothetical protein